MADSITLTWTWNPRSGVLSAKTIVWEFFLVEDPTGWAMHAYKRLAIRAWAAGEAARPEPCKLMSRLTFAEAMDVAQSTVNGTPTSSFRDAARHPAFARLEAAIEKEG